MSDERTDAGLPDVWARFTPKTKRLVLVTTDDTLKGGHHYIPAARVQRIIDEHNADRPNWNKAETIEDVVMHYKEGLAVYREELSALNTKVDGLVEALGNIKSETKDAFDPDGFNIAEEVWNIAARSLAAFREGKETP